MLRLVLCAVLFASMAAQAFAVSCSVAATHAPSPAEQAFLKAHFDQAATLYRADLEKDPHNPALVAALSRALLRQQKLKEADALLQPALLQNPNSAALLTAVGWLQYREGTPWLATDTAAKALKADPCVARLHQLLSVLYRLNSAYASAAKEIAIAHSLDPHDPSIRAAWLGTLPPAQRIAEVESYIAGDNANDPDDLRHWNFYLESLKRRLAEPHKACRLVSNIAATDIDFARLMRDGTHVRAYGLDVKLNDHDAHLEIDTGASGLLISRSVAERAGLKRFTSQEVGGIGSEGEVKSYSAYADTIRIGALEFHDCQVEVLDKRSVLDTDGLIGMDVFAHFLVTLDYPMRRLSLAPLPKRPDEAAVAAAPALETADPDADPDEAPAPAAVAQAQPPRPAAPALHDRYVAPEMKDWTRVYRVGHQLILPVALNDAPLPHLFILDTGAFSTSISPTVAREVTKVHEDDRTTIHGLSGKVDKVYTAEHVLFKFAGLAQETRDIYAFESPSISKNNGMEIAGFIGIRTLGQLTMTIDYRDALIKFAYDPKRGFKYE